MLCADLVCTETFSHVHKNLFISCGDELCGRSNTTGILSVRFMHFVQKALNVRVYSYKNV